MQIQIVRNKLNRFPKNKNKRLNGKNQGREYEVNTFFSRVEYIQIRFKYFRFK